MRSFHEHKTDRLDHWAGDNVIPLNPITAPDKADFSPDDWLSPLEEGTTFVSQEKNNWTPWLEEFTISCKGEGKITLLKNNRKSIENNSVICYWVDNEEFCRRNRLVEQLWIIVI